MSLPIATPAAAPQRIAPLPCGSGQFLSFVLDGESYAIEIFKVREIRSAQPVTRLPGQGTAMRGVINLRGAVLPVLDLRDLLGLPRRRDGEPLMMVVVDHTRGQLALVVDAVSDVVDVDAAHVSAAPLLASRGARAVCGVATIGTRMLLLLDLQAALGDPCPKALAPAA